MVFKWGMEVVPMLDILFFHLWKLCQPSLLSLLGTGLQIDFEARSGNARFLACQWKQNKVAFPLLLFFSIVICFNCEVVPEPGQRQAGLCIQHVLPGLHLVTDIWGESFQLRMLEALFALSVKRESSMFVPAFNAVFFGLGGNPLVHADVVFENGESDEFDW